MKNCTIGSCPYVDAGGTCYGTDCPNYNYFEEEEETKTLIEKLWETDIAGFTTGDVNDLIQGIDALVCDAMDLIDNKEYGKAWDKLLSLRVEIGEE